MSSDDLDGLRAAARPRARRDGDRRGRVRLRRCRTSSGCSRPARSTCLQADVTRCGGITGLLRVGALCARTSRCRSRCTAARRSTCIRAAALTAAAAPRVLPRPRAHRADALRRRRSSPRRRAASRPVAAGHRPRAEARRRGAVRGLARLALRRASRPERAGDRWWRNLRAGRMQQTLAARDRARAPPLGVEIYLEHYKGPSATSGCGRRSPDAGARGRRARRRSVPSGRRGRALPALSALYAVDGLIGVVTHVRGVAPQARRLLRAAYNLVMGPPLLAPGSLALVGGIGLLAAADRRASADDGARLPQRRPPAEPPRRRQPAIA